MSELKYDVRRGADTYRMIYHFRLRSWILRGIINPEEALVWRSGLSGWRRPEDLPELKPYFEEREQAVMAREHGEQRAIRFRKKWVKNILIVDDEEDLCWLLSDFLRGRGYNVSVANTIRQAVACLEEAPDLIFLDLKLPDGDGMDFLLDIKQMSPEALVVIISAYGSDERRVDATHKGVHGFIDKPLTEEKIISAIGRFQEESGTAGR